MKKILSIGKYVILVISLLFFIGLHIFVQQHNYQLADSIFHYVAYVTIWSILIIYFYCIFAGFWCEFLDSEIRYANLLVVFQVFLFFLIILFQIKFSGQNFWFGSKVIYMMKYEFPKEYLFDLVVIILFPASISTLLASVKETDSLSVKITSAVEIAILTLMGYFIFYSLGYVWLLDMAILNTVAVSAGMCQIPLLAGKRNGNRIACVILYVVFHFALLAALQGEKTGLTNSLYKGDWGNYRECVQILIKNAAFVGQDGLLRLIPSVQETLLCGHGNFIHSLLYYFGWLAVAVYIVALVVFFACLVRFLYSERKGKDGFYAVYLAAFWNLLLRAVGGILYSFAVVPFPIALPFAGKVGFVADMCCVALLLYNHLGGVRNEKFLSLYEEE